MFRQIWLDREVLSREAPKCSEDKPGGSGVGQREQVSSGSSVYVEDEIATEGGESGHVNHFGGGEGLRDGAFGGGEEMDGRRVEVSSEEVGRRAQLLMDRPALETMLLRLQEIEVCAHANIQYVRVYGVPFGSKLSMHNLSHLH